MVSLQMVDAASRLDLTLFPKYFDAKIVDIDIQDIQV